MTWTSMNLPSLLPFSAGYWGRLDRIAAEHAPDVIWACSDVPHAVLGAAAARRLGSRLVIDLYDNFESYPLSRVPGVTAALRAAIQRADGVTCISSLLARYIRNDYGYGGAIQVLENAIPSGLFQPGNKAEARLEFKLPANGIFFGTAGALSRGRGTQTLVEAFMQLAASRADVHLVLAGPLDPGLPLPEHPRIHYLGMLPPNSVARLLSALDISVICNRDSAFGRFCFPQKLYESLACGLPVAVARVGAMAELLEAYPGNVYEPDDVASLVRTLAGLCDNPVVPAIEIQTWTALGRTLAAFFRQVVSSPNKR